MFHNIGISGLLIIFAIALIVFGPAKLPQLGKAFGETLREFRSSTRGIIEDDKHEPVAELIKERNPT
ncbi:MULTISPECIES: twin-arginine translocase TatA/TatE family subunit [Cohnella]|uniref:Sec-independent protein translocase protein TatA n=1 Tax=Cohnella hashimotonis TaxID=2826895 RepID=A0ABT6TPL7_9BACL|nr:twin-arginine translocase TatA/TatE family subunit [Cohnella hashimotonis]MDI4648674.1 twin-arginine translocase TatA/TatE family subunit [Cohnella hashimotonis]